MTSFKGDSAISSGQLEVDFASDQVGDGDEIAQRAIAMSFGLCGLNEAVDGLDEAVGNLGIEPSQNTVAVPLDGARDFLDRLEARADGPAVPAIEHEFAPVSGGAVVHILKGEPDPIGACRFEVHAAERLER